MLYVCRSRSLLFNVKEVCPINHVETKIGPIQIAINNDVGLSHKQSLLIFLFAR